VAMVLIHPLLRANAHRRRRVHLVVFFIVLAANAGGATTPLGDPPLYLGFLLGVPFGWPLLNLTLPLLVVALPLLGAFWLLDRWLARSESPAPPPQPLRIRGRRNIALVALVVATVLVQGVWEPGEVSLLGQPMAIERLVAMAVFAAVVAVSLGFTPTALRRANLWGWAPMKEVAVLFAAIFLTVGPVMAMLAAAGNGPLAPLLALTSDATGRPAPIAYFWLAGTLSGFLDNAPTYLVFFRLAGGDTAALTGAMAPVLRALSCGAVFFGALTYIGNAPNMMVRAIAEQRGIPMPGFFAFVAYSAGLLVLPFILLTVLFFLP
jgi:Na+/H+ antiporter NhaD/arsenite permease-like protein